MQVFWNTAPDMASEIMIPMFCPQDMKDVASVSRDVETLAWATENPAWMNMPAPMPMNDVYPYILAFEEVSFTVPRFSCVSFDLG